MKGIRLKGAPAPPQAGFDRAVRATPLFGDLAEQLPVLRAEAKALELAISAVYGQRMRLRPSPFFSIANLDIIGREGLIVGVGHWWRWRRVALLHWEGTDLERPLYEHLYGYSPSAVETALANGAQLPGQRSRPSGLAERLLA